MKFNKFKAAAVVACSVIAGPTIAQSSAFTGWGIGLQTYAGQNKFEGEGIKYETSSSPVALGGSFGFALASKWVGTFGLVYDLSNTEFGTVDGSTATGKNHLALSFAPGYRIGEKSQLYAKFAYHQMTVTQQSAVHSVESDTFTGTGLGLGYGIAFARQFELRVDYETLDYEKKRGGAPKQNRFGLGLYYKF